MKPALPAVIAFALTASPLAAQEVAEWRPTVTLPAVEQLDRMCSPAGTMQYVFGATGVPGSSSLENSLGNGFTMPEGYAPFTKAQPRATEWSGRFMEMSYTFPASDEDSAYTAMQELGWMLEDAGWQFSDINPDDPPLYLMGYAGFAAFEKPAGDSRVLLGLSYGLGEVALTCGRDDLLRVHAGEAFGDLPEGTPRPLVPDIAVPLVAAPESCATAEMQVQMSALIERGNTSSYMGAMLTRTTYRDRLTSWMMWKLDQSGKLSPEELIDLSFGAIGDASPGGNPFASFAMIEQMFPIIDSISAAETAQDPAALCRAIIEFHGWIGEVDAITLAQTQGLHERLEAEAARLGVSLE